MAKEITVKDVILTIVNGAKAEKDLVNILSKINELQFNKKEDPYFVATMQCGDCQKPHNIFKVNDQLIAYDSAQRKIRKVKKGFITTYKYEEVVGN